MSHAPRTVALLPMKAHSQRVPAKNFRDFCGRPLFRWVLDMLLSIEAIDEVVINTDARAELARHGLTEGGRVRIRDRRADLCGDTVSMNRILADDVARVPADLYLMTHATNPLLRRETVTGALAAFGRARTRGTADSLFTVTKVQTRFYRADASPVNHDPGNLVQTQDLEPWFEENSNLYLFTPESFAATGARIGAAPMLHETDPAHSIDIDTPGDWDLAEIAARARGLREAVGA